MRGYPLTLVGLADSRCLVVGGGRVAARKVTTLVEAGARPVLIARALCAELQARAAAGEIEALRRDYQRGDLAGARLVIAATDDEAANEAVWQEAREVGCLVNVVDDPARCNFHVPATVRRGALTVAVATGGNAPALARRIRQELEERFDPAYEAYLDLLGELRPAILARVPASERRAAWQALLDSDVLDLLRVDATGEAREQAHRIVETLAREGA
ncbi:MAG: bifunctional precorrin-2 dehydrogenase/sirohydrochlorin ferrochelatase [Anaerolineae bacterium]